MLALCFRAIVMKNKMKEMGITNNSSKSLLANVLDMDDDLRHEDVHIRVTSQRAHPPIGRQAMSVDTEATQHHCLFPEGELTKILEEIRFIANEMKRSDEQSTVTSDWQFAAMVIDRICLIFCSSFTAVATIVVVFTAPHFIWD